MATHTTTDHDTVQRWAEARDGTPAVISGSKGAAGTEGVLQIDFPSVDAVEQLEPLSWEDWFGQFDSHHLALEYDDAEGSTTFTVVSRENA